MRHRPTHWNWIIALSLAAVLAGCSTAPSIEPTPSQQPPAVTGEHIGSGKASYYGSQHHNKLTASGERFDQGSLTAAHRTLPFGTRVKVINTRNGKSVVVRINDRGPFVRGRIIDLSKSAFERIGSTRSGVIPVRLEKAE
ncbi:septal ring lytic transglycosylase RlpA family protein [Pseudomonas stutzeri]|uniref:septal ring lytic transglycosylase RlpA family protein n=1 Tax=Stutzerimonas stutzeri TaxID=316 RepID=UPI00210A19EC|nr:septal ring lytic transglycosylase RlpA family protein [Stutzerimonas stutzeri]MCQ4312859.1 septal ring lytic transglycosylase RlpA family protein [Stutzerimonas stutzeri]